MSDYDSNYKNLFSHPEMVRDLLVGFVREDWVKDLDFSTLEKSNASYVSEDLKQRCDDLVWTVQYGDTQLYIYIIIEFQSTVDYFMSLRMMTYIGLLYQDIIKQGLVTSEQKLPPVLPIVLYNGEHPWNAPINVKDLVIHISSDLDKYVPDLRYCLIDEGCFSKEELIGLKNLSALLFQLEAGETDEELNSVIIEIATLTKAPEFELLRKAFTTFIESIFLSAKFSTKPNIDLTNLKESKTMLVNTLNSWYDHWIQKGEAIGLEKGLEKGREEGREEGRQEKMQAMLETAKNMLADGMTIEQVSKYTKLTVEEIKKLCE